MKKKILAITLCVAMLAIMLVSGTLAYFTDEDEATNVMTTGKVDIAQLEQQRDDDGTLVDFVQNKPLMPMVDTTGANDADIVDGYFNAKMNNVVDKIITVKNETPAPADENNRNYDAYVRTILAFETANEYKEGTAEVLRDGKTIFSTYIGTLSDFTLLDREPIVIDGVSYVLAVKVYEAPLKPQETSTPSLKQIFLSPDADNEVALLFGEEYTILAVSQGTQVAGFDSAKEALNTAFGDPETVAADKLVAWLKGTA